MTKPQTGISISHAACILWQDMTVCWAEGTQAETGSLLPEALQYTRCMAQTGVFIHESGRRLFLPSAYDNMENSGLERTKGIELTLEKFLNKGFYYLVTASVFDAGYRGYDGVWRNSAFNNNFVFNALTGYEWRVGRNSLLSVDLKMVYAGGHRKLPVDESNPLPTTPCDTNGVNHIMRGFPTTSGSTDGLLSA
jgi:hypothetical protein